HLVADELLPDQRPLAGGRDVGFLARPQRADRRTGLGNAVDMGVREHQVNRILGSRRASKRSEISIPTKVRTPISRMKLPARYMSCTVSARSSSGPAVGRLRTMAVMVTPEISSGSTQP